jgi:transcriptional regulator with XRE-family HTH domain
VPDYKTISLKQLREKKNWTQQDVADKLGITRQQYDKYEKQVHKPTAKNMQRLAEIFEEQLASIVMCFYK